MPETAVFAPGTVAWVDISSKDVEASKGFYSKLFNWQPQTIPDPQAGGYTFWMLNGKMVGALGPTMSEQQPPSAWAVYFATEDADATAKKVKEAGGKVIAEPFDVMDQGRMATFQDPSGAIFSVWQPKEGVKGLEDDLDGSMARHDAPAALEPPRPPQRVTTNVPKFEDNAGAIQTPPKM